MSNFSITVLSKNDWKEYKEIRLESLKDAPDSFGSTSEREASFAPEKWQSRLATSSEKANNLTLAACADQVYIGLLSAVIDSADSSRANLYQMWVDPKFRGMGVGSALVNRVRSWAVNRSVRKLMLSVTTVNMEATSLYQSIGFTPIGIVEPLRPGSKLQSQPMELNIDAGDA